MKNNPKLLAHRGYSAKYPENTLLAFKKAFEKKADGIECDLQKSKDNKFVIIHDDIPGSDHCPVEMVLCINN